MTEDELTDVQPLRTWLKVIHIPGNEEVISYFVTAASFVAHTQAPGQEYTLNNIPGCYYTLHPIYVDYDDQLNAEEFRKIREEVIAES